MKVGVSSTFSQINSIQAQRKSGLRLKKVFYDRAKETNYENKSLRT